MTQYTKKQVLETMRSKAFALRVVEHVESTAACHFMSAVKMDDTLSTIRDVSTTWEQVKRQQTSAVSVRFAYDFELALFKTCKEYGLCALKKEEGDAPGHDFRVETCDKGIILFEAKTTQSENGWTGSTHSEGKGKAESYVLINYKLDIDLPIPTEGYAFRGVVKEMHFSVLDDCAVAWAGEATNSNSSTTGKISVDVLEEYKQSISIGSVEPKQKWCKIGRESLASYQGANHAAA